MPEKTSGLGAMIDIDLLGGASPGDSPAERLPEIAESSTLLLGSTFRCRDVWPVPTHRFLLLLVRVSVDVYERGRALATRPRSAL